MDTTPISSTAPPATVPESNRPAESDSGARAPDRLLDLAALAVLALVLWLNTGRSSNEAATPNPIARPAQEVPPLAPAAEAAAFAEQVRTMQRALARDLD